MKKPRKSPPRFALWILTRLLPAHIGHQGIGDYEELYYAYLQQKGKRRADLWIWIQIFVSFPYAAVRLIYWSFQMFKTYLKTTLRTIRKQKVYSFINIFGLAVGIASSLMLIMFIRFELSYDRYHEKADRIYRIAMAFRQRGDEGEAASVSAPMAEVLVKDYPEIIEAVRFLNKGSFVISYQNKSFRESRITFTDASFFRIFTVPLLKGDASTVLSQPNSLVLNQETANKYFGSEDPIGKTLRFNDSADYLVTGIFEKIPENTHFHYDILVSLSSLPESRQKIWFMNNFSTYILLHDKADVKTVEAKLTEIIPKYFGPQVEQFLGKSVEQYMEEQDTSLEYFLQPLTSIHLHSNMLAEHEPNSDIKYVYIFGIIALFLLVIASINFMNLSVARASRRAKEVGIKKVSGSTRNQLIGQFLQEAILQSIIALVLALIFIQIILPFFNHLSGISFSLSSLFDTSLVLILLGIVIITGFMAGSYPAFILSSFQPVAALRGKIKTGLKAGLFRNSLVIFQFVVSNILFIGTLTVYGQLRYIQNKNIGFKRDHVLILENTHLLGNRIEPFKQELLTYTQVESVTISNYLPVPSSRNYQTVYPEGDVDDKNTTSFQIWEVDQDYLQTMGMNLIEGRNFSREFSMDTDAVILNQSAVRKFEWQNPLGKTVGWNSLSNGKIINKTVIGVVEDFHFDSLRNNIGPLLLHLGMSRESIAIRINTPDVSETLALIQGKWSKILPRQPFEYSFLDERFDNVYRSERRIGQIFGIFAVLTVIIGCLGLLGLVSYTAELKTKEIVIRKVLGASVLGIFRMLQKEFIFLVGIAILIAWPLAYYFMYNWLQDFSYRMALTPLPFIFSGIIVIIIALITVSYQAVKTAFSDPVKSLKYE